MHGIAQGTAIAATEHMTAIGECGNQGLGGGLDYGKSCGVILEPGKGTGGFIKRFVNVLSHE